MCPHTPNEPGERSAVLFLVGSFMDVTKRGPGDRDLRVANL
jgi:hypothetical protein